MVKRILYGVVFAAISVVFWNLLDFLYTTFITGESYQFTMGASVIKPLTLSIIMFLVLFVVNKLSKKKNQ